MHTSPSDGRWGYIYVIYCTATDKRYIGLTKGSISHRWGQHVAAATSGKANSRLYRAMRKYGVDKFHIYEVERCPVSELGEAEQRWIRILNTMDEEWGYNLLPGGGKIDHHPESRQKISRALKGIRRGPMSAEHKASISAAHRGRKPSASAIEKTAAANRGRKNTPEAKARMSAVRQGRPLSPEHKAAILAGKQRAADRREHEFQLQQAA